MIAFKFIILTYTPVIYWINVIGSQIVYFRRRDTKIRKTSINKEGKEKGMRNIVNTYSEFILIFGRVQVSRMLVLLSIIVVLQLQEYNKRLQFKLSHAFHTVCL